MKLIGLKNRLRELTRIESDLNRVINSLELEQIQDYSPQRNFVLSYLIDIRDDKVPKNLLSDIKCKECGNKTKHPLAHDLIFHTNR